MTEIQGNNRFWFEIGGCELSGVNCSSMCAHLLTLFEPTTNYKWLNARMVFIDVLLLAEVAPCEAVLLPKRLSK